MKDIISPVDTEDGLFHDGDPSTGTEGTVVSQKWLNPVQGAIISNQQELASVLKEAGIKIDPAKQDQLLAAIKKITGTATSGFLKIGDFGIGGGSKHKDDAYNNVGEIYRVNGASKNAPTTGVTGVVSLPCDGGPSTAYFSVSNAGNAWVGSSSIPANGIKWNRVYTDAYKPTAAELNVYSKPESDARYAYKSITVNGKPLSSNVNLAAGDVNAWNKTEADGRFIYKTGDTIDWLTVDKTLNVNGMGFIIKRGLQDSVNNERQTNGMRIHGAGDLFVDLYQYERIGQHHFLGIHVAGGGSDYGWYEFRNDGSFNAGSTVGAGGGGGSKLHPDGNIEGRQWGGYLSNWLNDNISKAQNNAQNWAFQNLVQNVRLTGRINQPDTGGQIRVPDGCVFTGMSGANYNPSTWSSYSYVQVLINGTWRNIGTS
uniref:hypothetical protein n=1 Tax=Serratia proteamaculans TaxID=28151 RepID=UPI001F4C254C|nr:hypothetical protein [Serratia proteamaculans]ULG15967.1 hypothetical protein 591p_00116 [Serratia proteamaculans]